MTLVANHIGGSACEPADAATYRAVNPSQIEESRGEVLYSARVPVLDFYTEWRSVYMKVA